jgi:hypothetical protein
VFAKAQASIFKSYFWKPKISWTFYGWLWLGLRNLECSCWKAAKLLQLQLSWTSAELSVFSCSWAFQLSWTSAELSFLNSSWTQLQLWTSLTIHQLNLPPGSWAGVFSPKLSGQDQLNWSWGAVQLVSDLWPTAYQSDWQTGRQRCQGRFNRPGGQFNRSGQPWSDCRSVCQACQGRFIRFQAEKSAQWLVLSSTYIYTHSYLSP